MQYLQRNPAAASMCEWKGQAEYWDLNVDGRKAPQAVSLKLTVVCAARTVMAYLQHGQCDVASESCQSG